MSDLVVDLKPVALGVRDDEPALCGVAGDAGAHREASFGLQAVDPTPRPLNVGHAHFIGAQAGRERAEAPSMSETGGVESLSRAPGSRQEKSGRA